jgi:tRNA(adenine34) deaminase
MWERLREEWRICLTLAWESYCEGSVPIAAVVTESGGKIVSRGRNRIAVTSPPEKGQIVGGPLAHAEVNALLPLNGLGVEVSSCELFTLVEPCPLCIGAICMAGVKKVSYAARDTWSGSVNLLDASPYLRWKRIEAIPPEDRELETLIHMLQVDHQLSDGHPRANDVIEKWRTHYPEDVRKGQNLYESGETRRMRRSGLSALDAVNHLYPWIGAGTV